MNSCCAILLENFSDNEKGDDCPTCGTKGKPVSSLTIRSLTRRDWSHYSSITEGYLCTNPEDSTLYYFPGSDQVIDKSQAVDRVGFKETDEPRYICYCFRHTASEIESDFLRHGRSTIEEEIREKVESEACSCEVTNPSGNCCLGDVRKTYLPLKRKSKVST